MSSHPARLIIQPQFDDGALLAEGTDETCRPCHPECWALTRRVISDVADETRIEIAQVCPILCGWKALPILLGGTCCFSIFDVGFAVLAEKLVGFPAIDIFVSLLVLEIGIAVLAGVIFCAWRHTRNDVKRSKGRKLDDDMMMLDEDNSLIDLEAAAEQK